MPELPEVEIVRAGLERWVVGRTVAAVEVGHPRAVRRHLAGPHDFAALVQGRRLAAAPAGAASTCGCRSTPAATRCRRTWG